jgi:phage gp36-like protein
MPVLTPQNMLDRYGEARLAEITTLSGMVTTVDMTALGRAVDDAISEVESYVAGLYDVTNPPQVLTLHAAAIAYYRLLGDRAPSIEGAARNYEFALAFLKRARAGEVALGDETPSDTSPGRVQAPKVTGPAGTFTHDTLKGF